MLEKGTASIEVFQHQCRTEGLARLRCAYFSQSEHRSVPIEKRLFFVIKEDLLQELDISIFFVDFVVKGWCWVIRSKFQTLQVKLLILPEIGLLVPSD